MREAFLAVLDHPLKGETLTWRNQPLALARILRQRLHHI